MLQTSAAAAAIRQPTPRTDDGKVKDRSGISNGRAPVVVACSVPRRSRHRRRNRPLVAAAIPTGGTLLVLVLLASIAATRTATTTTTTAVPQESPSFWPSLAFSGFMVATALATPASMPTSATALPKKVAVIGGTGRLGRATVDRFLERGVPCRCLVRPSSSVPPSWTAATTDGMVEIVRGNLVETCVSGTGTEDGPSPPDAIMELLEGCTHCVAVFGSTRKTKLTDLWKPAEDTDPDHPKQVNYQTMKMLVEACRQSTACRHIVRITGKGEDPNGFFSVLINGLGSMAKGWNYEGEQVLRALSSSSTSDVDYTIIRPGIMKEDYPPLPPKAGPAEPPKVEHLALADNGGNDLKVSVVGYTQIADLVVECCVTQQQQQQQSPPSRRRLTLAAMNVPGTTPLTLSEQIRSLQQDTREFPSTLIGQHKRAVRDAVFKVAGVGLAIVLSVLIKVLFF
jgi:hypothetical protein